MCVSRGMHQADSYRNRVVPKDSRLHARAMNIRKVTLGQSYEGAPNGSWYQVTV